MREDGSFTELFQSVNIPVNVSEGGGFCNLGVKTLQGKELEELLMKSKDYG